MSIRIILLVAGLCLALTGNSFAEKAMFLDFRKTVGYAKDNSTAMMTAIKTLENRKQLGRNAFAGFLPSVDFSSVHGINDANPAVSESQWSSRLSLGLTEKLYDNGETITRYRIENLEIRKAVESARLALEDVSLKLVREYLNYSLSDRIHEVKKLQYELLEKQFKNVSRQYRQGLRTRMDFLRFKSQMQRGELALLTAANDIERSRREIQTIIGSDRSGKKVDFLPYPVEKIEQDRIPLEKPDINLQPSIVITGIQEKIDELSVDLSRRKYWPGVYLTSGLSWSNDSYIDSATGFWDNDRIEWNVLLTVNYNIWDWGTRNRNLEIAERTKGIQDVKREESIRAMDSAIDKLMLEMVKLGKSYYLAGELLKLEEKNYTFLEEEYRMGRVSYLALITGLDDLSGARAGYFRAYYDLVGAMYAHRYYEGKLYESIVSK